MVANSMRLLQTFSSFVIVGLLIATGLAPFADADEWTEDAAAAVKQAEAGNKDMLLLFTGSDWCPPCMKLEEQALGQDEFQAGAKELFVLVKFDFPQTLEQSDELKKQNDAWRNRFGISAYPTLVLLDSKQRPYAFTGSRDEDGKAYLTHLKNLQEIRTKRDKLFEKADAAQGEARAKLLDEALSLMTMEIVDVYYESTVKEIVELDKDDTVGLRTKYYAAKEKEQRKALMTDIAIATRLRAPRDAIAYIDEKMAEMKLPADMRLQAFGFKLQMYRKLDDHPGAIKLLDEMIAIPELTPTGIQRLIVKKVYSLVGAKKHDDAMALLNKEIRGRAENLLLVIAKGELLDSMGDYQGAIDAYDQSMTAASSKADLLIELTGAKADALVEMGKIDDGILVLEEFVSNKSMPSDLRADALLHKAMILHDYNKTTSALRAESRALEIIETQDEKAQIQKLIDQIKARVTAARQN